MLKLEIIFLTGYYPIQQHDPKMMMQQRIVSGYQGGYQSAIPLEHHQVYNSTSDAVQSFRHHDNQRCSSTATMFGRSQHVVSPFHGAQQNVHCAPTTPQYNHALLRHQLSREALSDVTTKSRPRMTTRVWWRHFCQGVFELFAGQLIWCQIEIITFVNYFLFFSLLLSSIEKYFF